MKNRILLVVSAFLMLCATARADEAKVKNYVILPVTTDFQRASFSSNVTAYVQVNNSAIAHGGQIDAKALNLADFRKEISRLGGGRKGALMLYSRFAGTDSNGPEAQLLDAAIKQICRDAGFEKISTGSTYTGDDWKEKLALINSGDGAVDGADESPIDSDLVCVFPIRTRLSRFLTDDSDCVVAVRRPFDGRSNPLSKETADSIKETISKLKLDRKKRVLFQLSSTKAGQPVLERFILRSGNAPSEADLFAQSVGFVESRMQHSPTSGAPETLVGQPAPDFKLEALDGKTIQLQDAIRGRVAIVAFWGVACGPCCREAPHLSVLFQKYKDAGFTVVAVNAYNESKTIVSNFANQQKLSHPIALMGEQVAGKYQVGAYPTTFWVDRNGIVTDYAIDFTPGDEVRMAKTIEHMLQKSEKANSTDGT